VVGDLASLQQDVERNDDRAGLEDAVVDDREVGQVGAAERNLVARLDPPADQEVGDLVGDRFDRPVVESGVAEDDRVAVGVPACAVFES
jgi:hypothetical protein